MNNDIDKEAFKFWQKKKILRPFDPEWILETYGAFIGRKALLELYDMFFKEIRWEKWERDAFIKLITKDNANFVRFFLHDYDQIRFRNHKKDKKGRCVYAEAYFSDIHRYSEECNNDGYLKMYEESVSSGNE